MVWKPNKLIAVLLGLFTQSLAMLYLGRVKWAIFYFFAPLAVLIAEFAYSAPWLRFFSFSVVVAIICAVHAYRIASMTPVVTIRPWYSHWYGLVSIYLAFAVSVLVLRAFIFEPFRMPSGSMLPTIKVGAHMLVSKHGYGNYESYGIQLMKGEVSAEVKRGDLLVFKYPENPSVSYIKRVVGLPGDEIRFQNHQLSINGKPIDTRELVVPPVGTSNRDDVIYVKETLDDHSYNVVYYPGRISMGFEVNVPEKSYFELGDNRDNSRDSRVFGTVPEKNLVGKVVFITDN